jgi:hypothetical protein
MPAVTGLLSEQLLQSGHIFVPKGNRRSKIKLAKAAKPASCWRETL